jgi:prefoldin subunit 5
MTQALNDVTQSFDKFIASFIGTDNADKMREVAKAINFITENMKAFQVVLVAVLAAIFPVQAALLALGAVAVKFGIHLKDVHDRNKDLVPAIDDTGQAFQQAVEPTTTIAKKTEELAIAIQKCTEGLPGLTEEFNKLLKTQTDINNATEAMRNNLATTLDDINKQFSTMNILTDVLRSGFNNVSNAATEAFVGILKGTMSARDAGRMLADAIVTELLTAFVRLFIVGPIMAWLADQLGMIVKTDEDTARAVERTNRALQKQIGLRLLLMAMGFANGGAVQEGGQPQARASGGTTTGNMPYLVGERGPELFVPNSNGYIVPNDKLNMGGGTEYSMSSPGNMNVTFNINTVDARGFDQLLTTRQDLIVGMINRALTERGKRSLV